MVLYGVIERRDFMAYFLKKSKLKKGIYLQLYESFYDYKTSSSNADLSPGELVNISPGFFQRFP